MTVFFNTNLTAQIENGEVFYSVSIDSNQWDQGDTVYHLVSVGADPCMVVFGIQTEATALITLTEGVTSYTGSPSAPKNMRRDSAATTGVTTGVVTSPSGGSSITSTGALNGIVPPNSQLGSDVGLVLKANTDYTYGITNIGEGEAILIVNFFFREVK